LPLTARSLGPYLKALSKGLKIRWEILITDAVSRITGVVVAEKGSELTRSLGIVFIAQLERGVVVLLQQQGVTATERLSRSRVHYQQVTLMTWALCVELITVFIWRPERQPRFTALRRDTFWGTRTCRDQVLVHLTGASTMLSIAPVSGGPVQGEVLGAPALGLLVVRVEPELLGLWTWTSAKYLVTVFRGGPVDQLPARLAAGVGIFIRPGRGDYKT